MKKILKIEENLDNIIFADTDSCFASALPIIKKIMPEVDITDEKQMTDAILKVASMVQNNINKMFDTMAIRMFNLKEHRFDIKQEVIAKSSIWLAKKRYAQLIINKGGIEVDELEIKGIDIVRSSFPKAFQIFMKQFVIKLLNKVDYQEIKNDLLKFEGDIDKLSVFDISKTTSVRFISDDETKNYNPPIRNRFKSVRGSPVSVKAALGYNDLLHELKLDKDVVPIKNGQKIKWIYLKENPYGLDTMAFKADGTDPKQIIDFIDVYIDKNRMYDQELKGKLQNFYDILKWEFPSTNTSNAENFFSF